MRALLVTLSFVLLAACSERGDGDGAQGGAPQPTPSATAGAPAHKSREYVGFQPESRRTKGKIVMPLTFPDGSSAELVADQQLEVDTMTASLFTAGGIDGVDRTLDFRYGDGSMFMRKGPLETYEGADGRPVEMWRPRREFARCPLLVFRFGDWFVGARTCQDDLSEAERRTWARSLRGSVTDAGFLVLDAVPPLQLARAGEHDGPEVGLGKGRANWIWIDPGRCTEEGIPDEGDIRTMPDGTRVSFSRIGGQDSNIEFNWLATWCEDGRVTIQVDYAYENFARAAGRGLRLRDIVLE